MIFRKLKTIIIIACFAGFAVFAIHANKVVKREEKCLSWGVEDKSLLEKCKQNQNEAQEIIKQQQIFLKKRALERFNSEINTVNNLNSFNTNNYKPIDYNNIGINYYKTEHCVSSECISNIKNNPEYGREYIVTAFLSSNYENEYVLTNSPNNLIPLTSDSKAIPVYIGKLPIEKRKLINDYCDSINTCKLSVTGKVREILYEGYSIIGLDIDDVYFFKKDNLTDSELEFFRSLFLFEKLYKKNNKTIYR